MILWNYIVNPPFAYEIIHKTFRHLVKLLKNTINNLTFFIIIPAWYNPDRIELNKICKKKLSVENYGKEMNYTILKKYGHMKKYLIYCKNNFPYYSYLINKTVFYSATNLIIISNKKKNNFEYLDIFGKPDIVK